MFFNRNKQGKPNKASTPEVSENESFPVQSEQEEVLSDPSQQLALKQGPQPKSIYPRSSLFANTTGAPKPAIDFGFSQFQEASPQAIPPLEEAVAPPDHEEAFSPEPHVLSDEPSLAEPYETLLTEPLPAEAPAHEEETEPVAPGFDVPLEEITLAASEQFESEAFSLEVPPLPDLEIASPALWPEESHSETPHESTASEESHLEALPELPEDELIEDDFTELRESWQQLQQESITGETELPPLEQTPLPKMIDLPPSHIALSSSPPPTQPKPAQPLLSTTQGSSGDDFYSHLAPGFEEDLGSLVVEPLDTRPESLQDTVQESFYPDADRLPSTPFVEDDEPVAPGFDFDLDSSEPEAPLWEAEPSTAPLFHPGKQPSDELQAHLDILYSSDDLGPNELSSSTSPQADEADPMTPEQNTIDTLEEEAEVDIIDFCDLGNERTLALVDWDGNYALMGQRGDETDTVKVFDALFKHNFAQLPEETRRMQALKAFSVGKSDMFQVKVGTWSGVVIVDNESFVLQSEMS